MIETVKPKSPCEKVCADRVAGCQTSCERWKAYVEERTAWFEENHLRQRIESIDAELKILVRKARDRN